MTGKVLTVQNPDRVASGAGSNNLDNNGGANSNTECKVGKVFTTGSFVNEIVTFRLSLADVDGNTLVPADLAQGTDAACGDSQFAAANDKCWINTANKLVHQSSTNCAAGTLDVDGNAGEPQLSSFSSVGAGK